MAYGVKSGKYKVSFKGRNVGVYYVDADGSSEYEVFSASFIGPDYDILPRSSRNPSNSGSLRRFSKA